MKKKHFFLKLAIPFALLYWIFESAIHYFVFDKHGFEFIPHDLNELWMRGIIFLFLIAFGIFADYHTNKIINKDNEKYDVYQSMLYATQHILNNFLQRMLIFKEVAEESSYIDKETLEQYDQIISDTTTQINNLKNIQNPSKATIEERFLPGK